MNPPRVPNEHLWRHLGVPADAGDAWVEAFTPLQYAAYALRDTSGRPLGELNAPAPVRAGTRFDVRPCPYADARHGHPMNAGALGPVRDHLPWIADALSTLRAAYAALHPTTVEGLDLAHAWSFSAIAMALPFFLVRSGAAEDGTVPVEVAALFKVVQGVAMSAWTDWVTPTEAPSGPIAPEPWVDRMFERHRLFHRRTGRVCAGPETMIRELVTRCVAPTTSTPAADADGLLTYGSSWAALELELWLLAPSFLHAVPRVQAHSDRLMAPTHASTPADRITAAQRRIREASGQAPPPGRWEDGWHRPT
ncbi:MAG: hypothetical protein H6738_09845 [Alphaproteobacteria bacterium]|nr:hypothetical protein [Alphaproteobacteria bacterium]